MYRSISYLNSDELIKSLSLLKRHLNSCIGQNGSSKIIVTSGKHSEVSSCSSTLFRFWPEDHPVLIYIKQTALRLPDFALYFAVITLGVFDKLVTNYDGSNSLKVLCLVLPLFQEVLCNTQVLIRADLSSVRGLLPIAKNVLCSKPAVRLSQNFMDTLSTGVVQTYLRNLSIRTMSYKKVHVKVIQGEDSIFVLDGIVHSIDKDESCFLGSGLASINPRGVKIVLFTALPNNDLNLVHILIKDCVNLKIQIVFTQKLIHPEVKCLLRRNNIVAVERLGEDTARSLEQMSGSLQFPDVKYDSVCFSDSVGTLKRVYIQSFGSNEYLVLEADDCPSTMVIKYSRLELNSLKLLVDQSFSVLNMVVKAPGMVPGGGCYEAWVWSRLMAASRDGKYKTKQVVAWICESMIQASGLTLPVVVDSKFYHAWSGDLENISTSCKCQLVSSTSVPKSSFHLITSFSVSDPLHWLLEDFEIPPDKCNCILDSYILKRNAFSEALTVVEHLLTVGTFIVVK